MGMAASQARLLTLTARIHDVEYQAQMIQNAKLQLATQEDEVYRKYTEALDATTLTFTNDQGTVIKANFNNLCGTASIDNGLNKNYVFRTGDDDRLIVPADIFNAYQDFGGNDPYAFAMYMLGVDSDTLSVAEDKFLQDRESNGYSGELLTLKESMTEKLKTIMSMAGFKDTMDEAIGDVYDGESIKELLPNDKNDPNYDKMSKLIDEYKAMEDEFRYKLYQKGGAENIYCSATGEDKENFDQSAYNYYFRWGMLINQEEGLQYCIPDTYYSEEFANDNDLLNQMLQSGRITVDVVSVNKKGKLSDETTSVASDSNLALTNTSTIDKKALAIAEAEYEHEMKKIDKADKQYDMDLNRLETERTALTTEYDSVKKVIQDNVERTFGIFS